MNIQCGVCIIKNSDLFISGINFYFCSLIPELRAMLLTNPCSCYYVMNWGKVCENLGGFSLFHIVSCFNIFGQMYYKSELLSAFGA